MSTGTSIGGCVAVMMISVFASPVAVADPIALYTSRSFDQGAGQSHHVFWNTFPEGDTDAASVFQVTVPARLTSIELKVALVAGGNELDVWLLSDHGGLPNEILESIRLSGIMPSPPPAFNGKYPSVLAHSVLQPVLLPGVRYYVAVSLPEFESSAVWATFGPGSATFLPVFSRFSPLSPWTISGSSHESAFVVRGEIDPVPEPATLLLVGTGMAAIWRRAFKHNRCGAQ